MDALLAGVKDFDNSKLISKGTSVRGLDGAVVEEERGSEGFVATNAEQRQQASSSGRTVADISTSDADLHAEVHTIAPGVALIRAALAEDMQVWLSHFAMDVGQDKEDGFWCTLPSGERSLNATPTRGRVYKALHEYPEAKRVRQLCLDLVTLAQGGAKKLPDMNPSHLLLLYYTTSDGMLWHRDSDPNDGNNDHPIVSISLGNSGNFGYKLIGSPAETICLQSGDVLVWGGPQRMLEHCVESVEAGTAPPYLDFVGDARLNFTFRDAPNVLGDEDMYSSSKFWVDQ